MKAQLPQSARATLLFGVALLATPAFAQQGQNVTPPPVVPTVPQTEVATPPPTVQTAPASPIVQPLPATPAPAAETAAEPSARTTARRTAARTETRTTRTARTTTRAVPAEARAPAPRPAPAAAPEAPAPVAAPVQSTAGPAAAPAPAPVSAEAPVAAPEPAATTGATPIWPWLAGGALLALAALAFLLFRRRSESDDVAEVYAEEPVYEEPVSESIASQPIAVEPFAAAVVAPVTPRPEPVAPRAVAAESEVEPVPAVVAAEDATVADAESTDLVGMQAGSAPIAHRPWLELGMRPVRAGTMASEALVEVELIVGNAGDMRADNVRISTFMLPGGSANSEMEEMLVERANDTTVSPMTIEPGEGKCVDATLAVSKSAMLAHGDSFSPMIVADARYTLPDGSEGRTSASFRLGLSDADGNGMEPIGISHGMHDNVVAELEGAPARA